jgi:hypothetical protein
MSRMSEGDRLMSRMSEGDRYMSRMSGPTEKRLRCPISYVLDIEAPHRHVDAYEACVSSHDIEASMPLSRYRCL